MKRIALVLLLTTTNALAQGTTTPAPVPIAPPTGAAQPPATTDETASAEQDTKCKAPAIARKAKGIDGKWCDYLADAVIANLVRVQHKSTPAPLHINVNQPSITDTPGAQVSAGQTAAVASGQPIGSAGGSVAAVGATGQGLELVTALAINPGTLATGDTDSKGVWSSRLGDISIVLPANLDPVDGVKKGFNYIGIRARANLAVAWQRDALETKRNNVVAKLTALQSALTVTFPELKTLMAAAPDPSGCADAIEAHDPAKEASSCGDSIEQNNLAAAAVAVHEATSEFRDQVDHHYLSVEGRFDRGDLNADGSGHKDWLLAGYLAYGRRFSPTSDGGEVTIRLRGGAAVFEDGAMGQNHFALYGAGGIELAVVRDLKRYVFSAGAELYSKEVADNPMLALDQRNALKFGIGLPLADGKTVSIGLTVPVEHGDPILAISGDWSLLLETPK